MIEQLDRDLFRIEVPLPGNPLRATNAYLIRGEERELLIDTGFRRKECREALEEGLKELGSDKSRRSVLCTHLHSDHSGLADVFAGDAVTLKDGTLSPESPRIYLRDTDSAFLGHIYETGYRLERRKRFLSEGFPEDILNVVYAVNPAMTQALPKDFKTADPRFTNLKDGDVISAGRYALKTIAVPGHTPGNSMFYEERMGIMFTGDHILFDITPNITEWESVGDSLGDYLESLRKVRSLPVSRALPGHRKPGDYHARIDGLIRHHAARLQETERIIAEEPGLCGYEIAGRMRWKIRARNWEEFPATQKWFAVGECLSHLNYLLRRGKIMRKMEETASGTRLCRYYPS